ncbi:MAG: hypothetical protein AAF333_09860 [Planctomycetota bacterium]
MPRPAFELRLLHDDPEPFSHRFWILAEDLYRGIEQTGLGEVPGVDDVVNTITVQVTKRAQRKHIRELIEQALNKHGFTQDVEIIAVP